MKKRKLLPRVLFFGLLSVVNTHCNSESKEKPASTLDKMNIKGSVTRIEEVRDKIIMTGSDTVNYSDVNTEFSYKADMTFNEQGNIINSNALHSEPQLNSQSKFMYNAGNKEVCRVTYDAKEMLSDSVVNEYNEKGFLTLSRAFRGNGALYRKEEYLYNAQDQVKRQNLYTDNAEPDFYYEEEYNNLGLNTKTISYSNLQKEPYSIMERTFDTEKRMISKKAHDPSTGESIIWNYKFDKNGNTELESKQYPKGNESDFYARYKYNYDAEGNWIKKIEIINGEPSSVTQRKITYAGK